MEDELPHPDKLDAIDEDDQSHAAKKPTHVPKNKIDEKTPDSESDDESDSDQIDELYGRIFPTIGKKARDSLSRAQLHILIRLEYYITHLANANNARLRRNMHKWYTLVLSTSCTEPELRTVVRDHVFMCARVLSHDERLKPNDERFNSIAYEKAERVLDDYFCVVVWHFARKNGSRGVKVRLQPQ